MGTSFEKQFCNGHNGHHPITNYDKNIWRKTIAIVRNPYDRMVSIYNYAKLDKSYWHSKDKSTEYDVHPLYDYCHKNSFKQFIIDTCKNNKFNNIKHLIPQYKWLITPDNKIVTKIAKIETINEDLSKFLKTDVKLIKINASNTDDYYNMYDNKLRQLVYDKYKDDFIAFGYSK